MDTALVRQGLYRSFNIIAAMRTIPYLLVASHVHRCISWFLCVLVLSLPVLLVPTTPLTMYSRLAVSRAS